MKSRKCKLCGETFIPKNPNQKNCEKEHYKPCPVCGKPVKWIGYERCCSRECIREKKKQTCLSKYGGVAPACNKDIQSKIKDTMNNRYGVDFPSQSKEIRDKQLATYYSNFGKEQNPEGYADLLKRTKQTCLERYGEEKNFRSESHKQKLREANMRRYGQPNASGHIEVTAKRQANGSSSMIHQLFKSEELKKRVADLNNVLNSKSDCINEITDIWIDLLETSGVSCSKHFTLGDYEYSIGIPDQNVVISLDFTSTHNSYMNIYDVEVSGLGSVHHLLMTKNAEENGYRCIHVFDWDDMLKIISLVIPEESISAHKCEILEITEFEADLFFSTFSISRKAVHRKSDLTYIGLFYKGDLVEVAEFRKSSSKSYDAEFVKICSDANVHVSGGASKLFNYYVNKYKPSIIIAYCDRAKFTGDVYKQIGMKLLRSTAPELIWTKGSYYVSDIGLKMSKYYDKVLGKNYDTSKSKHESLLEAGYLPIYNCGKDIYEWRAQD